MGGDVYYVQITTDGEKREEKVDKQLYSRYEYHLTGYNQTGESQELTFDSIGNHRLKKQAFLKVIYNQRKGVTSYEEVTKQALPQKVQEKLVK